MPTAIDVFAKVRGHERVELFAAAREAGILPFFRKLEQWIPELAERTKRVALGE